MSKPHDRKALGRGLSALLAPKAPFAVEAADTAPDRPHAVATIPIELIDPNPLQPRSVFHPDRLQELANSIRGNGIIQPLIVRRSGERYQLVAGERRWRAAKLAGLDAVPAVVRQFEDNRLLEITLIENIQREDLNPIEVARAFERLTRELSLTHEQIAERTGKDRATITNTLRLLKLPGEVQNLLADRRISMGHARAVLGLPTPELQCEAAERAVARSLSVRQLEQLVNRMTANREPRSPEEAAAQDPNVKAAVENLERVLGTRVRIVEKTPERGRIEIDYFSQDELHRIYSLIASHES